MQNGKVSRGFLFSFLIFVLSATELVNHTDGVETALVLPQTYVVLKAPELSETLPVPPPNEVPFTSPQAEIRHAPTEPANTATTLNAPNTSNCLSVALPTEPVPPLAAPNLSGSANMDVEPNFDNRQVPPPPIIQAHLLPTPQFKPPPIFYSPPMAQQLHFQNQFVQYHRVPHPQLGHSLMPNPQHFNHEHQLKVLQLEQQQQQRVLQKQIEQRQLLLKNKHAPQPQNARYPPLYPPQYFSHIQQQQQQPQQYQQQCVQNYQYPVAPPPPAPTNPIPSNHTTQYQAAPVKYNPSFTS
jgi:hypothetical protein